MPVKELARLITAYRWLERERVGEARKKAAANVAHIDAEIDALFMRIASFSTGDRAISFAQIDFLVTTLAEDKHAAPVRSIIKEAVLAHVKRLADASARPESRPAESLAAD